MRDHQLERSLRRSRCDLRTSKLPVHRDSTFSFSGTVQSCLAVLSSLSLFKVRSIRHVARVKVGTLSQAGKYLPRDSDLNSSPGHRRFDELQPELLADTTSPVMSSINQQGPLYSAPQGYEPPYKYDEAIDPQIPRNYPESFESNPPPAPQQQPPAQGPHGGQGRSASGTSEPKQRLRKACDSCSVRKVKVSIQICMAMHRLTTALVRRERSSLQIMRRSRYSVHLRKTQSTSRTSEQTC